MKINKINNQNFTGAYIVKGSGEAIAKFQNELALKSIISRKGPNVATHPLTTIYSPTQPYAELLVCTGEHIENLRKHILILKAEHASKLRKFAEDFQSWSKEKKEKWRAGIQEAISNIESGEIDTSAPGENALNNGNPDIFLSWYSDAVKKANQTYKKISKHGLPFPAKIRRIDANEATNGLIANNFNLKEGFFRKSHNPKVEIEETNDEVHRYIDGKLDSIITQKPGVLPLIDDEVSILATYTKVFYDNTGKLKESITYSFENILDGITTTKTKF